ncbi:hypothetical protein V7139_26900, partial [Neobacillus drentensis]
IEVAPQQDYCVPVTPIMPGPGFCPPFGGFPMPMHPFVPFPQGQGGAIPMPPVMPSGFPGNPGAAPSVAGTSFVAPQFDEESSFMPQLPVMNPAYNQGAVMGAQSPQAPMGSPYMNPSAFGQMPQGF